MSLENNIKRLADAAERIAAALEGTQVATAPAPEKKADKPAPPAPAPAAAPAPPAKPAEQAAPPPPAAAAPAPTLLTPDQMNDFLVEQFKRLGNTREPIDKILRELGAQTVRDLKAEDQQKLIDAVKALPGA